MTRETKSLWGSALSLRVALVFIMATTGCGLVGGMLLSLNADAIYTQVIPTTTPLPTLTALPTLTPLSPLASAQSDTTPYFVALKYQESSFDLVLLTLDGVEARVLAGNIFRIGDTPPDAEPSWSPDGSKVAYIGYDDTRTSALFVINVDGSEPTSFLRNRFPLHHIRWSPDGTRIAAEAIGANAIEDIYVVNIDGSGEANLTNHPSKDLGPTWSPDSSEIAFISDREAMPYIFVMSADGSNVRRTSDFSPAKDGGMAWSSDGKRLAYGYRPTNSTSSNVIVYNTVEGKSSASDELEGDFSFENLHWSPDDQMIVFNTYNPVAAYATRPDGSGLRVLPEHMACARWNLEQTLALCGDYFYTLFDNDGNVVKELDLRDYLIYEWRPVPMGDAVP